MIFKPGDTPLSIAGSREQLKILQYLLEQGAQLVKAHINFNCDVGGI